MVTTLSYHMKRARTKDGRRKLRLFGCACCRRVVHLFPDESFWSLVDLVERLADGTADQSEIDTAFLDAELVSRDGESDQAKQARSCLRLAVGRLRGPAAKAALACVWIGIAIRWLGPGEAAECAQQVGLLRDIFGNPFHPLPVVEPAWLAWNGGTTVQLARTIYDQCRFEDMPILGDALEEAGCNDTTILEHCRQASDHVRGCWLLDLLRNKIPSRR
jgi:hypothetical protein